MHIIFHRFYHQGLAALCLPLHPRAWAPSQCCGDYFNTHNTALKPTMASNSGFVLGVCHGLLMLQAVQAHIYVFQLVLRFELLHSRRRHYLSTSASGFATRGAKKSAHFLQTLWHEFCTVSYTHLTLPTTNSV